MENLRGKISAISTQLFDGEITFSQLVNSFISIINAEMNAEGKSQQV